MTTALETIPAVWSAADENFFRVVATDVLTPKFLLGAGVLLASHDVETLPAPLTAALNANPRDHLDTAQLESAGHHGPARPASDNDRDS
jgi:hypothetical protein